METSTRIIDYHLKERIDGQNSKITSTGRNIASLTPWLPKSEANRLTPDKQRIPKIMEISLNNP
jgi:hypothetical protein